MAGDNDLLKVRRPNGRDPEADKIAHDNEMAKLNEQEKALNKNIADMQQLSTLQALFNSNTTVGRIKSLQCSRDEPPPASAPPPARHEVRAWDGVVRGSPAEEYAKNARGGLDAVHGDTWHFQQSQNLQDAEIGAIIDAALGKLLLLGGRLFGALRRSIKPHPPAPEPAPAPKPASPGNGTYVAKPVPKHPPGTRPASEEIKDLSKFEGKSKSEIEQELREAGYTEVPSNDGTGSVWTKTGSDGKTASVRLDPGHTNIPEDYSGAKPHAHKEMVSSDKVTAGNYKKAGGFFNDTGGSTKFTDFDVNHIPIRWE